MPFFLLNKIDSEQSVEKQHDWRSLLLILTALFILWAGPPFLTTDSSYKTNLTLEEMIRLTGNVSECGSEPRRAIFEMAPIDINLADAEVLASLRGIGPKLAERIVAYRKDRGAFKSVSEILRVKGVGRRKLAGIIDKVRIGACDG